MKLFFKTPPSKNQLPKPKNKMPKITLTLPKNLNQFLPEASTPLAMEASSIQNALQQLVNQSPAMASAVFSEEGTALPHLCCFVNGQQVQDFNLPLKDQDEVKLILAIVGG